MPIKPNSTKFISSANSTSNARSPNATSTPLKRPVSLGTRPISLPSLLVLPLLFRVHCLLPLPLPPVLSGNLETVTRPPRPGPCTRHVRYFCPDSWPHRNTVLPLSSTSHLRVPLGTRTLILHPYVCALPVLLLFMRPTQHPTLGMVQRPNPR